MGAASVDVREIRGLASDLPVWVRDISDASRKGAGQEEGKMKFSDVFDFLKKAAEALGKWFSGKTPPTSSGPTGGSITINASINNTGTIIVSSNNSGTSHISYQILDDKSKNKDMGKTVSKSLLLYAETDNACIPVWLFIKTSKKKGNIICFGSFVSCSFKEKELLFWIGGYCNDKGNKLAIQVPGAVPSSCGAEYDEGTDESWIEITDFSEDAIVAKLAQILTGFFNI
jgi:hypothetical protein